MTKEEVVRLEAKHFFENKVEGLISYIVDDNVAELRSKIENFYASEDKSLFLDELYISAKDYQQKHIDDSHDGISDPTCRIDMGISKYLYFIKQERDRLPKIAHQKSQYNSEERTKVFVSYSHRDKDYLDDIKRHFKPFLKKIDFWDDTKIRPGQKWKDEIVKAIRNTKVAILLVSTDFLGSEFIATEELPPLLKAAEENGAVVLIVILKPCLFEEFPELSQYQAINTPARPVSNMTDSEKEELYVSVVRQTKDFLDKDK